MSVFSNFLVLIMKKNLNAVVHTLEISFKSSSNFWRLVSVLKIFYFHVEDL